MKEYEFWTHKRYTLLTDEKTGKQFSLARYRSDSNMPRPEGYKWDVEVAEGMDNDSK